MKIAAATMHAALGADGRVGVEIAHHKIGNGIPTRLAMAASDDLGVPIDAVAVRLGDTALPPAGISGGSFGDEPAQHPGAGLRTASCPPRGRPRRSRRPTRSASV